MAEKGRPKVNFEGHKELDKMEENFIASLDQNAETMAEAITMKAEESPPIELSQSEKEKQNIVYVKPDKFISSQEPFNESYRKDYEFAKENVIFRAVNDEVPGESIQLWCKAFPGMPALRFTVPVDVPVCGPRYLAEQLTQCAYSVMIMEQKPISTDGSGTYYGAMSVSKRVQRLNALPETTRKSIFMAA